MTTEKMTGLALVDPKLKPLSDPIKDIRAFSSKLEHDKHVIKEAQKDFAIRQVDAQGKKVTYTNTEIFKLLIKILNIKVLQQTAGNKVFNTPMMQDFDNPAGIWIKLDIDQYIVTLSTVIEINDINRTIKDIEKRFQGLNPALMDIPALQTPPPHIVLALNCVVNLKSMEQANDRDYFGQYDFLHNIPIRVLPVEQVNPVMYQIVTRIHNDWGKNDADSIHYLKQLQLAAMEGDGKKTYNVLKGDGGNGKSTFLYILENLAGRQFAVKLDLQGLMDDNSLSDITPNTKIIMGHDLATNAKLSNSMLSRFKEFTLGEGFQIKVKYKPNQLCEAKGLKVQNTNNDISFFENSDAIKRRLRVFNWTNTNFTKLATPAFNLDELVGVMNEPNLDFYEAIVAHMFEDMEYFTTFIPLKEADEYTENMINKADAIHQFVQWLDDQELLETGLLPTNILYQMYTYWMRTENQGSAPMKRRGFTDKVIKLLEEKGFKKTDDQIRLSHIDIKQFNFQLLNSYLFNNHLIENKNEKTFALEAPTQITDSDISMFESKMFSITSKQELTFKEMLILEYLIQSGNTEALTIQTLLS